MTKRQQPTHRMLRIETTGQPTRLEDLLRDRYRIGRGDSEKDVRVDFRIEGDEAVSRVHAVLSRDGGAFAVENRSSNGTLVNGVLVEEPRTLESGDAIVIGEKTRMEYLILSASERARAFDVLAGKVEKEAKDDVASRSLVQRPVFWIVIGIYGIVALLLLGTVGRDKTRARDPGPGPYFGWVRKMPLRPVPGISEGRREIGERMWADALRNHAGPFAGKEGHDFRFLMRARIVLETLGYSSVKDALASEEVVAETLVRVLGELEDRVSGYYKEAKQSQQTGQGRRAREGYERIIEAVPDREAPIRRYAAQQAKRLRR